MSPQSYLTTSARLLGGTGVSRVFLLVISVEKLLNLELVLSTVRLLYMSYPVRIIAVCSLTSVSMVEFLVTLSSTKKIK